MNLSSYDLIDVKSLTTLKDYANLGESAGKLVIAGVNMIPTYTVTLATEQTVAGYTFTTAGESLATTSFFSGISSLISALSIVGTIIAIGLLVNSYLSAMWAVDSIKRQRDKFLTMFRRIKRLNRIADINTVVYGNMEQYLDSKIQLLNSYEKSLNDKNLQVRDFISSKTNTYLLSNPIITFLQNEQNVLDIIKQNNYKYINVISFIDYQKDINIIELDKVRIANADNNTLKTYIDNLNACLVMIDKLEELKLYEQVIKDINFIKNNINILLVEIKKTYIEQLDSQNITNPLQMLEEITTDIPFLDLSAQTEDIGGLSLYPKEYIINDIPLLFNQLNKKDIMILVFNNIYIIKFIKLMESYYQNENFKTDTKKYIDSAITTYNLLNEILSLKNLKEKNVNQILPNNIYVDNYRIFTYFKKLFINKTKTFLKNYYFTYKKSNNVNVSNPIILNNKIDDIDQYFYNKKYSFNDFLFYFDFDTNDDNQKIDNIDLDTIKFDNFENLYFSFIEDIRNELNNYGVDIINYSQDDYRKVLNNLFKQNEINLLDILFKTVNRQQKIENIYDFVFYFFYVLTLIQSEINKNYEKCQYKNYSYTYNILSYNNKIVQSKQIDTIRTKNCILVADIIDEKIQNLESKLYQVRYDYKYEYSVFSDLFLSETSYFLFEMFTKLESITNSSVALIKDTQLSINNYDYNINFYDILFEFFTKYINNYSGYIYSNNNYLKTLTTITQSNFVSVLNIAFDYKSIDIKINDLNNITQLSTKQISQTQLRDILDISEDIDTTDILSNIEVKEPNIKQSNTGKIISTIIGVALLSK